MLQSPHAGSTRCGQASPEGGAHQLPSAIELARARPEPRSPFTATPSAAAAPGIADFAECTRSRYSACAASSSSADVSASCRPHRRCSPGQEIWCLRGMSHQRKRGEAR